VTNDFENLQLLFARMFFGSCCERWPDFSPALLPLSEEALVLKRGTFRRCGLAKESTTE
jgi:hypothetical protein